MTHIFDSLSRLYRFIQCMSLLKEIYLFSITKQPSFIHSFIFHPSIRSSLYPSNAVFVSVDCWWHLKWQINTRSWEKRRLDKQIMTTLSMMVKLAVLLKRDTIIGNFIVTEVTLFTVHCYQSIRNLRRISTEAFLRWSSEKVLPTHAE